MSISALHAPPNDEAYCTMVLTDDYVRGALVVARQLRLLDPSRPILCLATHATLSAGAEAQLLLHFDKIVFVEAIDAGYSAELALLRRSDLRLTVTKIRLWSLSYSRIVYLDADTLPLRSLEGLFELNLPAGEVAASPDCGWPDLFNSGVMALTPSEAVQNQLLDSLKLKNSIDGADQGLFNQVLRWHRLPFLYNVTVNTAYEYVPAYRRFQKDIKVLHFIGPIKPWKSEAATQEFTLWWNAWNSIEKSNQIFSRPLTAEFSAYPGKSTEDLQRVLLESSSNPEYDPSKIIQPPADYWDAKSHEPFHDTRPEGERMHPPLQTLALSEPVHEMPEFGESLVVFPFEKAMKTPEREF